MSAPTDEPVRERLHALFEREWAWQLDQFPEMATILGEEGTHDRWTDQSEDAVARRHAHTDDVLAEIAALETGGLDGLDEADRFSLDLFRRQHELKASASRFPSHLMPVTKMSGPVSMHRAVATVPPTHTEGALARLRAVPDLVDQLVALLDAGRAAGVTPPRFTVDDIPDQIDVLATQESGAPLFLAAFERAPEALQDEAAKAFAEIASPALTRLADHLRATYVPACRETVSWSHMPDGEAWYRHLVRSHTTTDLDPQAIHDIGREEVASIRAEMDDVIAETGHRGGFESFCEHLRTSPEFYVDDAEELLTRYRDICKRIDPELPRLFGTLPRLTYGVKPVPDHEAPSTTTAYYLPGAPATGRPGWFMANTYDLRSRPIWEMEALTLHEAVPGHHLQIALAAELEGVPRFRRVWAGYTAFVEGWGLYAEKLGHEMGLYADPYSRFGALTYQMWRAVRLVVDTGMHVMGWSREDAIEFFRSNSSKPLHDITVEVDRYIAWPGQALAYKIGERTISRLRAEASDTLGGRFDVREFHDVVLGSGSIPLDALEARVRQWVHTVGR